MVKKTVSKYMAAGVSDVLGCFGVPSGAVTQIYNDVLDQRAQDGVEVLLSEVRQGHFDGIDQNDAVSIIARFQRDAMEGVARNNLRLMARVINGMAKKKKLKAPSFLRYANILASLTDKEIRVLAVMARHKGHKYKQEDKRHDDLLEVTEQAEGHLQALMRTGLVNMKMNTVGDLSEGTHNYQLTKLMDELLEYLPNIEIKDKAA